MEKGWRFLMYFIDTNFDEPDIELMKQRVEESMRKGICITDLTDKSKEYTVAMNCARTNMQSIYGIENPNSPTQIINYLIAHSDENIIKFCYDDKAMKWTTKAEVMEELAGLGYTFAIDLLRYRKLAGYVKVVNQLVENLNSDGRLHPDVFLGKTNRINYRNPGLMNINKELLWDLIVPRTAGNSIYSIDIKNQEPWTLINKLGIKELKELLEIDDGKGLYEKLFVEVYGRDCNKAEKDQFKASWNALTYGGTKFALNNICRTIDPDPIMARFNKIKEFKKYKNDCKLMADRGCQTVETAFGTVIETDELGKKLVRQLMDLPIQGTGSDILALLIEHFYSEIEKRGLEDKLEFYYSRHDELLIEVDKAYEEEVGVEAVTEVLADIFEHRIDDWEPYRIEIKKVA